MSIQLAFILVWAAVQIAICVAAVLRGGLFERSAAFASLFAWLAGAAVTQSTQQWRAPHPGLFAVDLAFLIVLLTLALASRRGLWLLFACGFQLASVSLHVAAFVAPNTWAPAYFTGLQIMSCLVLGAITLGVLRAWRHEART